MKKLLTYEEITNQVQEKKPGIYDEPNKAYHAGCGVSSSELKKLLLSGAHYDEYLRNPPEQSKEMVLGSMVHTMLLEPEKFEFEYHTGEFNVRRGKDYEAALKAAEGKTLVSREDVEKAAAIVEGFKAHAKDHPYLNGKQYNLLEGVKEHSFYSTCPHTGILRKVRPDNITPTRVITDIKTTRNAGFDSFQKSIVDFGYYLSAAYYLQVVKDTIAQNPEQAKELGLVTPEVFCIVAIESEAPHAVQTYFLNGESIRIGEQHVLKALKTLLECATTGKWEGYPKKMVEIGLPNWAMYKFNKE